jgi:DNA-directed RNA polymerase subunit RPC12/RpoP
LGGEDLLSSEDDDRGSPTESGDHATWENDRRQLDALLKVDATQSNNRPDRDELYDFTITCLLCGTRQEAKSEQVGHSVRCPDCHSKYKVREPSHKSRRPRKAGATPDDEEIRLSEPDSALPTKADFRRTTDRSAPSPQPVPSRVPSQHAAILTPQDASRDTLARAQKELEEQLRVQPPLPGSPMTCGVFRFLQHPTVVLRIFFIALAWWLELGAIQAAVDLTHAGPIQQFASVILRPFALVFGLLLAANFAMLLLNVAQDTSHGRDEIENLPGANPVEWFFDSWPILISLFLTLALAGVTAQAVYSATGSLTNAFLFGLLPAGFLLATIFPVILLSFLDNNTPFSSDVLRGLRLAAASWLVFTIQALVLASLGIGLFAWRWSSSSAVVNFGICVGLVVLSLLFFRLLGRLTWACHEKLTQETEAQGSDAV